jgi:putative Ca2+/H+ antiporter (TMEM165/GDT1 family)
MKWNDVWLTFGMLFLAEMGDKTQLAVVTLVADKRSPAAVFIGAATALTLVSLLGVVVGSLLAQYVPTEIIHKVAAVAFIVIGALMLFGKM